MNHDFKGLWIPREIWLNPNLSTSAKLLWSALDYFCTEEKGGCVESNKSLCELMHLKERRLREVLSELKDQGFVEEVSFDGRLRVLKALHVVEKKTRIKKMACPQKTRETDHNINRSSV